MKKRKEDGNTKRTEKKKQRNEQANTKIENK